MIPLEIYQERINRFKSSTGKLQKRGNRLSLARLIIFLLGLSFFIILLPGHSFVAFSVLIIFLGLFAWLVAYHNKTEKRRDYYDHLVTINQLEKNCLDGDYYKYPDGSEYINREHTYSFDLDIFGHASIYQYINRTTSKPAADLLASWLKVTAEISEIALRQQAVNELKPLINWRQQMITLAYNNKNSGSNPVSLVGWMKEKNFFCKPGFYKYVTFCLSILVLLTTAFIIAGLSPVFLLLVLSLNFIIYFSQVRKISRLHEQVSRSSKYLLTYAETIHLIENAQFEGSKLKSLQNNFSGGNHASVRIKKLSQLVSRLDARLNIMVSIPLNLFFFWDIHCCLALEKWKADHTSKINSWFSAMAEFEVLASLANMAFNNPQYIMPRIIPEYFSFKAANMGHPLIPLNRRVNNDFEVVSGGKMIIVTGSNMSGKSTFLRTCGVNAILAMAGAPVCANSLEVSHTTVYSCMRISDSLEDNTSSFYAELKKLSIILKEAEQKKHILILLDEILRGTNSNDRHTGAVALIRQLVECGAAALIATHDLQLSELAEQLPENIRNYHFDVKVSGDELYFDYKLTPGVCKSMNASILMKKMGIKI
jgi:hypothetical protein